MDCDLDVGVIAGVFVRAGRGVGVVDDVVVRKLESESARAIFVCRPDADHGIPWGGGQGERE